MYKVEFKIKSCCYGYAAERKDDIGSKPFETTLVFRNKRRLIRYILKNFKTLIKSSLPEIEINIKQQ